MSIPYILSVLVAIVKIQVTFSVLSFGASRNYVDKGSTFTLTCHVTPLTGIVEFFHNNSIVGSCNAPFPGLAPGDCVPSAIVQDIVSENTTWTILSASFSGNNGSWKCNHNAETGETFVLITDLAKNMTNNDAKLPVKPDKNTEYAVYADCSYPKPEIKWKLRECIGTNNNIDVISNPSVIENSSTCAYPAQMYSSTIKVSNMISPGTESKCYKPFATLYYLFPSSVQIEKESSISFELPGVTTTVSTSTSSNSITTESPPLTGCGWICILIIVPSIVAAIIVLIVIIICCVRNRKKWIETNETKTKNSTDLTSL